MRSMFGGDRSSPNPSSRRGNSKERHGGGQNVNPNNPKQQHAEIARPLAASAADANSASSRRRQMAFLKYGSSSTSTKPKKSSSSMNRMREHARQITMQVSQSQDGCSPSSAASTQSMYSVNSHVSGQQNQQQRRTAFADFSTAFGGGDDDGDDDEEEEDLFAPMHQYKSSARTSSVANSANANNNTGFANFDVVPTATAAAPTHNTGFANFDAAPTTNTGFANFDEDPFSLAAAPPPAPPSSTGTSSTVSRGSGAIQSSPARRTDPFTSPTAPAPPPAPSSSTGAGSTVSRGYGGAVQSSPARRTDPFTSPNAPAPPPAPSSSTGAGSTVSRTSGFVQSSPGRQTMSNFNSNSRSRSGSREMEQQQQQRSVVQPPQQQQQQQQAGFETDWPSASPPKVASPQSMSTFPANSSMQASFVSQAGSASNTPDESKLREPVHMTMSPSFTSSASGATGAAARRRVRNQMRKAPGTGSTTSMNHNDASSTTSSQHQQLTPPQSPHSRQRRQSGGDSVGSGTNGRTTGTPGGSSGSKIADHVQHYSVQQQRERNAMVMSSTNGGGGGRTRSVDSRSRSATSSNSIESDPHMNLFDVKRPDGGLSFDAFGLDASQFDRDVNQAMEEIAGSHPDLSHFMEADPADDFAAGRWDSPVGSRSSTPVPEEEGFENGFRVTKQGSKTTLPLNARQSPTASTDKSSWTSEGSEQQNRFPTRNQFKEQAGFHASHKPRKVIRPNLSEEGWSPTRNNMAPQRSFSNGNSKNSPRMPILDDGQPVHRQASPRRQQQQQNVEFVGMESDSERAGSDFQAISDVGAVSDVNLASDVGVSNGFAKFDTFSEEVPKEVSPKKKKKNQSDASTVDSPVGEEKKEDAEEPPPEQTVGSIRSRWEQGDAALSQGKAKQQREKPIPTPLRRDHIDNLQNQLGHEILSPEKLQQRNQFNQFRNVPEPQKERADECSEQRTSFASIKGRLKSPTDRDERAYSTSKSEGGAAVRHSHFNSALNKFNSKSPEMESPRDAKSDAGGSPAFGAFTLRKTGFSKDDSPRVDSPAEHTVINRALNDRRESQSQSSHSRQDYGNEQYYEKEEQSEEPQPKKLTYRERRELELQKEKEEEERRMAGEKANVSSQPDVATLIKRRIAANKNAPVTASSPAKQAIRQESVPSFREKLKPVETISEPDFEVDRGQSLTGGMGSNTMPRSSEDHRSPRPRPLEVDRGQSSTGGMGSNTMPRSSEDHRSPRRPRSPFAAYQTRDADLVIEEAAAPKQVVTQQNETPAPSSAVSRMAMLKQLEQRQPTSEEHSKPPPSPVRDNNRMSDMFDTKPPPSPVRDNNRLSNMFDTKPPPSPVKDNNRKSNTFETKPPPSPVKDSNRLGKHLAVETATSADSSDDIHSRASAPKATTPKATMVMLNAFLTGRESIGSADGASGAKPDQSEAHPSDAGDTITVEHSTATAKPAVCIPTAVKDDPKYERFFRMLKIGMPLDVVKHAMVRDGVDPSVMDGDPNKPAGVPLKDDPTYKKYFKMLGFGLPMEAVKHAMERDGLDSTVMDGDHDLPINAPDQAQAQAEPIEKDSHRRARLHWKPLRKVTSNSLWAKIDQEIDNIEIDEEEFQELFQVEKNATAAPTGASAKQSKRGSSVRVIDPKRANNGGIVLARLKMSHDDMADAVDRIDENALTAEQIENIVEYLPTKEERRALEAYMLEGGQDAAEKFEGLCECEKFMVSMMTVKHAKRKVRALLFKLQFESCLEDIHNDTVAIESACDELSDSTRLRQLFGFVLTFGNRLNMAGSGGNVNTRKTGAFSLDSLLKLREAKAFDKKTTFLHYLVLIVQRNNELLLNFKDDLPTVFKADKVFWDQCLTDLEEVENQLENVRKIALYQAHQARQAHIYRVRRRKQRDDDGNESLSEGEASLTLEEEVEALRATSVGVFTLSAIKYVSSLRDRIETTKSKFFRLLEYFGEEDKKKQPHELFSTIVAFSRDFDKEKEKVFAKQKNELREERKRQAKATKVQNGKPPTHSPAQVERPLKSSNMQPSMSGVLAEMKARSPAVPKPVLSPVREVVAQESPTTDRSSHPHVQQNNMSYSNPPPKSPRSSNRYHDEPAQKSTYTNPAPQIPMPSNGYNDGSVQQNSYSNAPPTSPRLSKQRNDESVQESSYSNPASRSPGPSNRYNDDAPAATPQRSTEKEMMTPNRTQSSGNDSSQPMQAPYTTGRMNTETNRIEAPPTSMPTTPRTANAMRQKARLRRQRITSSPANSVSTSQAEPSQKTTSAASSDSGVGQYNSGSSAQQAPVSPARSDSVGLRMYSRSSSENDDGAAQPLPSPRASFRDKRRIAQRRKMRAGSEGVTQVDSNDGSTNSGSQEV